VESIPTGAVVLARFPFSDLKSKKLRPCLVIGLAEFEDLILCQITSSSYGSQKAISLNKTRDFSKGSLITDSYIRPDKISTLDSSLVFRQLGLLNSVKIQEVKSILKKILEIA